MVLPFVLVEWAHADADTVGARALLEACSQSVHVEGGCVEQGHAEAGTPAAVAIVAWTSADRRAARVDVGARRENRDDWRSREISFARGDAELERWRAVGLVVAALVGEVAPPHRAAPDAPTPAPPSPPLAEGVAPAERAPRGEPAPVRSTWRDGSGAKGWVEAGAVASRPTDSLAAGFAAHAAFAPRRSSPVVIVAGVDRAEQTFDDVDVRRWVLGAGIGVAARASGAPIVLDTRVEMVAAAMSATSTDAVANETSSESRWVLGARQSVGISWLFTPSIALTSWAQTTELTGRTVVNEHSRRVTSFGAFDVGAGLGVRAIWGH